MYVDLRGDGVRAELGHDADRWRHQGLFRDGIQLGSGLLDLVVGVRHHRGGGHRLTVAGERFVGLVAEDVAEVRDCGGEFGVCRRGEGAECETGDGGCRFEASEAVGVSRRKSAS